MNIVRKSEEYLIMYSFGEIDEIKSLHYSNKKEAFEKFNIIKKDGILKNAVSLFSLTGEGSPDKTKIKQFETETNKKICLLAIFKQEEGYYLNVPDKFGGVDFSKIKPDKEGNRIK